MKVILSDAVLDSLADAPLAVRKAFFKQIKFLEKDLHHPSLRAKKSARRNMTKQKIAGRPG
jgi:hypothetical protein